MPAPVKTPILQYNPMEFQPGTVPNLGVYLVLTHVFMMFSRFPELMYIYIGTSFHILIVIALLALFAVLLTGSLRRVFSSPITAVLLAFSAWMIVCLPFSVWRGGTVQMFKKFWGMSLLTCIMITAMIITLEHCRKAVYTIAAATLAILVVGVLSGSTTAQAGDMGRYGLEEGTLKNSNTFAAILLMGLPFCLVLAWNEKRALHRNAGWVASALIATMVIRTGSRSGLIALAVLAVMIFLHVPLSKKILMIMGAVLLGVIGVSLTSQTALDRYRTLLSGDDDEPVSSAELSAERSSAGRKRLLIESIVMTFKHPLVGVGPGMFLIAAFKESEEKGAPPMWRETHNSFTQVSSETGFPGLLLYVGSLFLCFRACKRLRKATRAHPDLKNIYNMASGLRLSLIAFTITGLFSSQAYFFFFPLLAGLTASFYRAAQTELAAVQALGWRAPVLAPVRPTTRAHPQRQPSSRRSVPT